MLVSLSILGELMGGYGGEVLGAVGRLVRAPCHLICVPREIRGLSKEESVLTSFW